MLTFQSTVLQCTQSYFDPTFVQGHETTREALAVEFSTCSKASTGFGCLPA